MGTKAKHSVPASQQTGTGKAQGPYILWVNRCAIALFLLCASADAQNPPKPPSKGVASWYGEAHRGKLMANGKRFDPDKFTAASWFFPLGTKVRVSLQGQPGKSVLVTITDRGPDRKFVRQGRIIDLGRAPFRQLAHPDVGLVAVMVTPLRKGAT